MEIITYHPWMNRPPLPQPVAPPSQSWHCLRCEEEDVPHPTGSKDEPLASWQGLWTLAGSTAHPWSLWALCSAHRAGVHSAQPEFGLCPTQRPYSQILISMAGLLYKAKQLLAWSDLKGTGKPLLCLPTLSFDWNSIIKPQNGMLGFC